MSGGITDLEIDKFLKMKKMKILKTIIWEFIRLIQLRDI